MLTRSERMYEAYDRFVTAITRSDYDVMQALISDTFEAVVKLSSEDPAPRTLNAQEFIDEIEHQRRAFPDMGKNIIYMQSGQPDSDVMITKQYLMIATFDGELSAFGKRRTTTLPGNGKTIEFRMTAQIVFDRDNRIVRLIVTTTNADEVLALLSS